MPNKPVKLATEYQLHTLDCPCCGASTSTGLPASVPSRSFGPRVQAMVSVLSGKYRMTKRNIEELMTDFFRMTLALGSVSNLEQATSEALADPAQEAKAYVAEQPVVNVDETGWREANGKAWLWVAVSSWGTMADNSRILVLGGPQSAGLPAALGGAGGSI